MIRHTILCGICIGFSTVLLRGGSLISLTDSFETSGKISVKGDLIQAEGGSSSQRTKFDEVLQANFDDADFHLDYFSSRENPARLPSNWQGQDIGHAEAPGSFTYADGTLTINGNGADIAGASDNCYFIGQPWAEDGGQWTAHIKERSDEVNCIGLMLRGSFDPDSPACSFSAEGDHGFRDIRGKPGSGLGSYDGRFVMSVPGWIRLTRFGGYPIAGYPLLIETSNDGKTWDFIEKIQTLQDNKKIFLNTLAGLVVTGPGKSKKVTGKAVVDQILFTPPPAQPEVVLPGVLLRSGTFLAGRFNGLDASKGEFNRKDKPVSMTADQVCAAIWVPVTRRQIAAVMSQPGLIMKNEDFMVSDLVSLDGGGVRVNSLVLGPIEYNTGDSIIRAFVLHPLQLTSSDYEIRLKDGSIIRAKGLEEGKDKIITIKEVSGIDVNIAADEIAQFRAGPAKVQNLIDLPWTVPTQPAAPKPAIPAKAASAANPATAANPIPDPSQPVQCWEGDNQEQIMAAAPGTILNFPLPGKFRALAMRVAFSSNAPPNAQASIRVLADGRDINRTSSIKAGDQPQFVEVSITGSRTISLVLSSFPPDTRLLLIDPVAIRE
ncbi:MAG: NPCBM/NEW2 domain-containing protein [Methylacidiphilales bacterium]|nr:NPCBM/NEW2 domain-containing protein [Candidatus Methylacidiphilales bacterium]